MQAIGYKSEIWDSIIFVTPIKQNDCVVIAEVGLKTILVSTVLHTITLPSTPILPNLKQRRGEFSASKTRIRTHGCQTWNFKGLPTDVYCCLLGVAVGTELIPETPDTRSRP